LQQCDTRSLLKQYGPRSLLQRCYRRRDRQIGQADTVFYSYIRAQRTPQNTTAFVTTTDSLPNIVSARQKLPENKTALSFRVLTKKCMDYIYRVSQKSLCSKVPRTTLQFFLQQMLEMSRTGLKTCPDTLLHRATRALCCCTATAAVVCRTFQCTAAFGTSCRSMVFVTCHKALKTVLSLGGKKTK
jgi:hypothetical protein